MTPTMAVVPHVPPHMMPASLVERQLETQRAQESKRQYPLLAPTASADSDVAARYIGPSRPREVSDGVKRSLPRPAFLERSELRVY